MSELREQELRDLLDGAADLGGEVDVDRQWAAGRRRRTRRGAGMALAAGVVGVALVGGLVQTGLLGGATPVPTGPAAVPDGYTTFVFAAPDAPAGDVPGTGSGRVTVPSADDLAGTSWVLTDQLWGSGTEAAQVVGGDPGTTTIEFSGADGTGWGFDADGCGGGWFQEDLTLSAEGRFPAGGPATDDQGCPPDAQAAEDFWIEALGSGGYLRGLEDDWLLVSVVAPTTEGTQAPTTDPPGTESPTTEGTAPVETTDPVAPTSDPVAPTSDDEAPTGEGTGAPVGGPPFVDPDEESVHQPFPAGGGDLFAPTVRAGAHEGFDRVVVDLTGSEGEGLGWRAAYTDDPRLDGSGMPADVAGDSVLQLTLAGMGYPEPGSDIYAEGTLGLDTHTLGAVVEVQRTTPFEGMLQVFVGMQSEPRPYRVFLLQDPMRLVIDVQTSS